MSWCRHGSGGSGRESVVWFQVAGITPVGGLLMFPVVPFLIVVFDIMCLLGYALYHAFGRDWDATISAPDPAAEPRREPWEETSGAVCGLVPAGGSFGVFFLTSIDKHL